MVKKVISTPAQSLNISEDTRSFSDILDQSSAKLKKYSGDRLLPKYEVKKMAEGLLTRLLHRVDLYTDSLRLNEMFELLDSKQKDAFSRRLIYSCVTRAYAGLIDLVGDYNEDESDSIGLTDGWVEDPKAWEKLTSGEAKEYEGEMVKVRGESYVPANRPVGREKQTVAFVPSEKKSSFDVATEIFKRYLAKRKNENCFDCATATQVISFAAEALTLGRLDFDAKYLDGTRSRLQVALTTTFSIINGDFVQGAFYRHFVRELKVGRDIGLESQLEVGDIVYFENHSNYEELAPKGAWAGEWAVVADVEMKDGEGVPKFKGFGVSGFVGAEDMGAHLQEEFDRVADGADGLGPERTKTLDDRWPGISVVYRPKLLVDV